MGVLTAAFLQASTAFPHDTDRLRHCADALRADHFFPLGELNAEKIERYNTDLGRESTGPIEAAIRFFLIDRPSPFTPATLGTEMHSELAIDIRRDLNIPKEELVVGCLLLVKLARRDGQWTVMHAHLRGLSSAHARTRFLDPDLVRLKGIIKSLATSPLRFAPNALFELQWPIHDNGTKWFTNMTHEVVKTAHTWTELVTLAGTD